ncbi:MAG TPA: DEAD/DEAH box helicase [Acidimicrobiales bacterium]
MQPTELPGSFAALGAAPELVIALESQGITDPFPIQALTIADALAGRDVCGKAKTGSGKTLAFGVPMLQRLDSGRPGPRSRRPRGLVLVPTRELARQVADVLLPLAEKVGLDLTPCYGGAGMDAQIKALADGTDVVVATPGRLIDLRQRGDVDLSQIEVLVLDEADRMADMGFMPQVEWLLRHLGRERQTMLFSATLDGDVDRLVRDYLADPVRHEVESSQPTVTEMAHRFLLVHQMDKVKVTAAICRHARRSLVFSRTKRGADRLTEALRKEGVDARAIHGDLRQQLRERALRAFADGKLPVLVATDVAARGIDVDGIDVVIHFDPPEDHKGYLHRSGRTARAGRDGLVVTLVLWNEQLELERIQRRLGLATPVVEMFSNDPRLRNLRGWDPAAASVA